MTTRRRVVVALCVVVAQHPAGSLRVALPRTPGVRKQPPVRKIHQSEQDKRGQRSPTTTATTTINGAKSLLDDDNSMGSFLRSARAAASTLLATGLVATSVAFCGPPTAFAENELTEIGARGFDASLIDGECFASKCDLAARNCLESGDCRKGMTCTAKCLGDNECITGCFAKYGNREMNELLECSVDRNACVKIAILPPGPETATEAKAPPVAPLAAFDPSTLRGEWYKVMGWNSRYDCFDCQKNTFTQKSSSTLAAAAKGGKNEGKKNAFDVQVEFAMPRPPRSRGAAPSSYPLKLTETLVFDDDAAGANKGLPHNKFVFQRADAATERDPGTTTVAPRRHAASEGHLFGLTFWENWSVLGESPRGQRPEWKFVYYTGKTTQNTYDGAFVYARDKTLPDDALRDVFALAERAGFDPKRFCAVNNDKCDDCATTETTTTTTQTPPPGVFLAETKERPQKTLFVGAATAAEDPFFEEDDLLNLPGGVGALAEPAPVSGFRRAVDTFLVDLADYLEDPKATAQWVFGQQRKVDLPPPP